MARVVKTKSDKDVLCNYCIDSFANCPRAYHIKFGNGVGNDNVIECSEFRVCSVVNSFPIEEMPDLGVIRGCCRD